MGITLVSFIIVLGVLIFFHEFGHFLIARLFGVGVEKFSLGFGPRLIGKKIGRTDYRISAIPLGGYVKMIGEEPDAEVDPADISVSFTNKHVGKRMCIVAAGPFFNILLAIIIFFGIFTVSGAMVLKPSVGTVSSVREPSLIMPYISPRSRTSPGRTQHTIRRANWPVICRIRYFCIANPSTDSSSTMTTSKFSFSWADSGRRALRNFPGR